MSNYYYYRKFSKMKERYKLRTGGLRNMNNKLKILGVFLMTIVMFCYVHLRNKVQSPDLSFFKENVKFLDALNATECILPKYDIYDEEIRPYIDKPPTPIVCGYVQPYLTFLDWDGTLYLNKTEAGKSKYSGEFHFLMCADDRDVTKFGVRGRTIQMAPPLHFMHAHRV